MKSILVLIGFLGLVGCQSVQLNAEEAAVRILKKSDPDSKCKDAGKVNSGLFAVSEQDREDRLRKATHEVGANTVTLDRRDDSGTLWGTAYKCP